MEKLVIIDSCMRLESRTKRILDAAKEVLSSRYDIEIIDVGDQRRDQTRPCHKKHIGHRDFPENLTLIGPVNLCTLQLFIGNIHQNTCGTEHLERDSHPEIDQNDHHMCPARL